MAAHSELEFCLLGPLLVRRGGTTVPVPSGMQRSLLAELLLNANTVVPVDQLAEVLWGSRPPPSARASLQNLVLRLRRSLADSTRSRITAHAGGYQIRVEPGELDVHRFEALAATARAAERAGAYGDAAAGLRAALALWRGQPLAGIPSTLLATREVPRLDEMRLQALEARIDADLRLGRPAEVIAELRQFVAANPLRERMHALLMMALYADGQQAQALAAYRSARAALVSELGVEPGPELRAIHQQILAGAPAVPGGRPPGDSARPAEPATADSRHGAVAVPRQLPGAVPHFTGRTAELAELADLLDRVGEGGTVVISAIGGSAGIGKTALAVHWAHQVADRFPDGQLYVNLRGFGPSATPMTPAEAIRLFLDGLGVAPKRIPVDLAAQAALYRSLLARKRTLIVLDNARDPAQVRPLLPGSPTSLVLVTSRNQLTGLVAAEGASLVNLDVLTEQESGELLARRLAPGRVAAEPAAVSELTRLCARLPLALSIAAARAAARPELTLAALVAELRDAHARLDALGTGDEATDMRTVLSWSCQQLSQPAGQMFCLIGLHPGPDITVLAAASLAAVTPAKARQAIAELVSAHLISEHRPARFACHDLLRAYAAEQAASQLSAAVRQAAIHRLLDYYLHTSYQATMLLSFRDPITVSPPQPAVTTAEIADRDQAMDWFLAESQVLFGVVRLAAATGFPAYAWQLPWAMATSLDRYGYWHELVAMQQAALAAAEQLGDLAAQAEARRYLARGYLRLGSDGEAIALLLSAAELGARVGDSVLQARTHHDLGGVFEGQGRIAEALAHADQARRLYRSAGHRWGEALALSGAGWAHAQLSNYDEALDLCGQAMVIFRELDIKLGQPATLDSLGYVHHQLGNYAEAITCYTEAIAIEGAAGDRRVQAEILIHLGDSWQAAGNAGGARDAWQEALAILEELHPSDSQRVRTRLGEEQPTSVA